METALRHEITQKISQLANSIYPTNAPENYSKPYMVYYRVGTNIDKTLGGFPGSQALSYIFSIMATRYADMISLRDQVESLLLSLPGTSIGDQNKIQVQDIDIRNISEVYEPELRVNRGIIDFTIYY